MSRWTASIGAVARFHDALVVDDENGVYVSLTEALEWLTILAERIPIKGDTDVISLIYARERAHHQSASIIHRAEGDTAWRWRPANQLPVPEHQKHQGLKHKPTYEERLAGKPMVDALDRVVNLLDKQ